MGGGECFSLSRLAVQSSVVDGEEGRLLCFTADPAEHELAGTVGMFAEEEVEE